MRVEREDDLPWGKDPFESRYDKVQARRAWRRNLSRAARERHRPKSKVPSRIDRPEGEPVHSWLPRVIGRLERVEFVYRLHVPHDPALDVIVARVAKEYFVDENEALEYFGRNATIKFVVHLRRVNELPGRRGQRVGNLTPGLRVARVGRVAVVETEVDPDELVVMDMAPGAVSDSGVADFKKESFLVGDPGGRDQRKTKSAAVRRARDRRFTNRVDINEGRSFVRRKRRRSS